MKMMLGVYCLARLREASYDAREREGIYGLDSTSGRRYYLGTDLNFATKTLLDGLPEACRSSVTWREWFE